MVKKIKQKDFKEFDVLVSYTRKISDIFEIIIFVNIIKDEFKIV